MSGGRPYAEHLIRVGISPEAGIWSIRKSQGLRERIQNLVMSLGVLFWKSSSIKPLCSLRCRRSFGRMSINFRRSSSMSSASLKSSLGAPQYPKPNRAPHKVESCFSKAFNIWKISRAVWAEFVRPSKVSIRGGSHEQSRGAFRSHSSLSMSGLRQSHVFSDHEDGTKSGRNRCALLVLRCDCGWIGTQIGLLAKRD